MKRKTRHLTCLLSLTQRNATTVEDQDHREGITLYLLTKKNVSIVKDREKQYPTTSTKRISPRKTYQIQRSLPRKSRLKDARKSFNCRY